MQHPGKQPTVVDEHVGWNLLLHSVSALNKALRSTKIHGLHPLWPTRVSVPVAALCQWVPLQLEFFCGIAGELGGSVASVGLGEMLSDWPVGVLTDGRHGDRSSAGS